MARKEHIVSEASLPDRTPTDPTAGAPGGQEAAADSETKGLLVVVPFDEGLAAVFGDLDEGDLGLERLDVTLLPTPDRDRLAGALAAQAASVLGNSSTVIGNVGNAFATLQGFYRVTPETQALLDSGATLAPKDGANLGTLLTPKGFAQARFVSVTAISAAQMAAAVGPAIAMLGLQIQLNQLTGLLKSTESLTRQMLHDLRQDQHAEVSALSTSVNRALEEAREVGEVPTTLWEQVAHERGRLDKQLHLYREKVADHIVGIRELGETQSRKYLAENSRDIALDTNALLVILQAEMAYQSLHVARAQGSPGEAGYAERVARDARNEGVSGLRQATSLIGELCRELELIGARRPGLVQRLPGVRRDTDAGREHAARLLEAIRPLARALGLSDRSAPMPEVVCAPDGVDPAPYLTVLGALLADGEDLRGVGFVDEVVKKPGVFRRDIDPDVAFLTCVLKCSDASKSGAVRSLVKAPPGHLIAVTDRRIVVARSGALMRDGATTTPIECVGHVKQVMRGGADLSARTLCAWIDDDFVGWRFHRSVDSEQVDALETLLKDRLAGECEAVESAESDQAESATQATE